MAMTLIDSVYIEQWQQSPSSLDNNQTLSSLDCSATSAEKTRRKTKMTPESNILALDHVTIPIMQDESKSSTMAQFLTQAFGASIDPTCAWMHLNMGMNQVHLLPNQSKNGLIPGSVALSFPSLYELKSKLKAASESKVFQDTLFHYCVKEGMIIVTGPAGNRFLCYKAKSAAFDTFPKFPGGSSFALGIPFVEHFVPIGSAEKIARFYTHYFNAPCQIFEETDSGKTVKMCVVSCGTSQSLILKERDSIISTASADVEVGNYHICFYIRDFQQCFDKFYSRQQLGDNPNYPENCFSWEVAVSRNQFRVCDVYDICTNEFIFSLEHEIRSQHHPKNCLKY